MRRLTLRREILAELTTAELASVAAGALPTLPVRECIAIAEPSGMLAACESVLRPCVSYTCTR